MKKVILGIIIGVILTVAVPAAADEITKKVTATVRSDFSIELDGEYVKLQNSPLAYNGNSYLPVRELASLLDKDVDFKDGVIKLGTPNLDIVVSSKVEFEAEISKQQRTISEYEKHLDSVNELIAAELDKENPRPADMETLLRAKTDCESVIEKAKQAITDLKAKYPQYA